jgi:hypothetical protein
MQPIPWFQRSTLKPQSAQICGLGLRVSTSPVNYGYKVLADRDHRPVNIHAIAGISTILPNHQVARTIAGCYGRISFP